VIFTFTSFKFLKENSMDTLFFKTTSYARIAIRTLMFCSFTYATTANAQNMPDHPVSAMSVPTLEAQNVDPAPPSSTAAIDAVNDAGLNKAPAANKDWDIAVGGGMAIRPTYEGSDRYRVSPVPFFNVTYDDMISLGPNGLSAYWHHDNLRIGGGLTYDGGRKDSAGNGIFTQGDDRLKGLGDIDSALGLKAFASYDLEPLVLSASLTKFTGSQNDGVLVDIGASLPYKVTDAFMLTPHIGTTWANQSYMQTFFGVTPTQSADSRFSQFSAGSGFKDVGAGINANYRFDEHWFIGANADVKELTGDAAKSPISYSNTETTFMTMVGYHF